MVSGDGNGTLDVFVRDVKAGHTTRVSVDSLGIEGNGICATPAMSANGRYIAYGAWATNLVAGDINAVRDVFVHDRKSERTIRASLTAPGTQADHTSVGPSITASGRYIAFHSSATNLVANDTNAASDVFVHDRKTGRTTRVSVSSFGIEGDGDSRDPAISANGRYVAFVSAATTLVAGDGNESSDVFVHDRKTGQTTRVSVDSLGNEAGFGSFNPMISASGRYVVFWSMATNLVVGDGNGSSDVFVHDRKTGQTTRVSVDSAGIEGNFGSEFPAISANGRHVAFHSSASNLVSGDGNGTLDVFVHDRKTRQTTRVSVNSAADEGNDVSYGASLSANGRYVAFLSYAGNLVPGDPGGVRDAFVHDRVTGQTTKVSVNEAGVGGNDESTGLRITADGRYVAFISLATNLVAGDGNGTFDVFVRDLKAGQTTRVSVDSAGIEGNDSSVGVAISANGRYVAFDSLASNLVLGDVNGNIDVFVRDMK
ncbi:MAG: PD40 domain-containing protein [Planctomycetes bacterium]|nr:PD40 domain-containing protein [Planctomycetota bacterium]